MARLSPPAFQACFIAWTRSVANLSGGEVVAIDGKTLRRSHDQRHGRRTIHMVSAWADANHLSLGQVVTAEKSNESTAIPKLLELKGCIVTIDAMGCQTAIAAQLVAKGADDALAAKENQPLLYEALDDDFKTARVAHFQAVPVHFYEHTDAGHGRYEVRRYWLVNDLSTLPDPHTWAGLRGIGRVETERHEGEFAVNVATSSPAWWERSAHSPTRYVPTGASRIACTGSWMSPSGKTTVASDALTRRLTSIPFVNSP